MGSLENNKPTVTVVVATYNGSAYLLAQLESIAQQTHKPTQIIIIDDASTDDTINRIRSEIIGFNKFSNFTFEPAALLKFKLKTVLVRFLLDELDEYGFETNEDANKHRRGKY